MDGPETVSFYGKGEEMCESYSNRRIVVGGPENNSFWDG